MKRFITFVCSVLVLVLLTAPANFSYHAAPVKVKLSFTAPLKGQLLISGQPFACKGSFRCSPATADLAGVHVWLFLTDTRQSCYYIKRPVSLNRDGSWAGTLVFRKDQTKVLAVLADQSTDKLFRSWLAKGLLEKQYELPQGIQFLAGVDVRI